MDTAYIETTVVGNIAGRMHPDPLIAARQVVTRKWWATAVQIYRLLASELVIDECNAGDPAAAGERLAALDHVELLDTTAAVEDLAAALVARKALPASQPRDAFHIAIAAVNGVRYLVTWNFKHIANPTLQSRIASVCRDHGFEPPIICTPEQLLEAQDDSDSD
jgi:predicted nucleic acid-binding protein